MSPDFERTLFGKRGFIKILNYLNELKSLQVHVITKTMALA